MWHFSIEVQMVLWADLIWTLVSSYPSKSLKIAWAKNRYPNSKVLLDFFALLFYYRLIITEKIGIIKPKTGIHTKLLLVQNSNLNDI